MGRCYPEGKRTPTSANVTVPRSDGFCTVKIKIKVCSLHVGFEQYLIAIKFFFYFSLLKLWTTGTGWPLILMLPLNCAKYQLISRLQVSYIVYSILPSLHVENWTHTEVLMYVSIWSANPRNSPTDTLLTLQLDGHTIYPKCSKAEHISPRM